VDRGSRDAVRTVDLPDGDLEDLVKARLLG
jgi:hypothetical protein